MIHILLVVLLGGTVVTDLGWRIIPNWLTLPIAGLALGYHLSEGQLLWGVLGLVGSFSLAWPAYTRGLVGGGDLKFLLALGAVVGVGGLPRALLWGVLSGGVWGWIALRRRGAGSTIPYGAALAVGVGLGFLAEVMR